MRNIIVSTYATLDGRADNLQEWTIPYNSDAAAEYHADLLKDADGLLLGRRTYEIFAMLWPARAGQLPYIDTINGMAKYVVSTTLHDPAWNNSHTIADLDQLPDGNLVVYGGHALIRTLREHDLIDEYRILVHPVLLGTGPALVDDGAKRTDLRLVDTTMLDGGVVVLTYRTR
ncbi:dihydrofolate reductase family protein [Virgisporangium aurantiacum]|uniref:Pyrimidine reductase n=1 Tax=Virgisporangium aurantiacum TaxID=175570 RepID=A0A8J3ZGS6_9ACTN|nr:dihydrofolate reductase family protein [Virgisporangium aurantiacum]GIJ63599.1 pyrimidine reductase [Virgisporangium aurantiacum]